MNNYTRSLSNNVSYSSVLKKFEQVLLSKKVLVELGLPTHPDLPKNWDSLIALKAIVSNVKVNGKILDAGGEFYSSILPQLNSFGYKNLTCINLTFSGKKRKENIIYEYGDATLTRFKNDYFDAITCLSVIEHGVNFKRFLQEMNRILINGGLLIVSTDYWYDSIDTKGKIAFNSEIIILNYQQIEEFVQLARMEGFELISPLETECEDKVVSWNEFDLHYTFILLTFFKKPNEFMKKINACNSVSISSPYRTH